MSDSVRPHRQQPTRLCRHCDSPCKNTGVGCHFLLQCMRVKSESEVAQSCLTSRSHSPPIFPNLSNLIEFVWHQWLSYTALSEKAMAPHSSTLAWRIPWMEEPGGLQSMGSLELDMTEQLHFHFSLSCIGEGNGNPLQCSCLKNPRGWGAWWAAVYGVTQSRTRLKQLSSSSSRNVFSICVV